MRALVEFDPCDRRAPAVEELAAELAWERGGCTMPVGSYDLDRAEEIVTGRKSLRAENARLRSRIKELENELAQMKAKSVIRDTDPETGRERVQG